MKSPLHIQYYFWIYLCVISCHEKNQSLQANPKEAVPKISKAISNIPQFSTDYQHEVMVLGSFHFNRGTDGSDVVAKNHIDITTEKSQKEIEKIVADIAEKFKPTQIAVEWMPSYQYKMDSLYKAYLQDSWKLSKNEAFQIGFRVAKRLGLSGVHCVDNRPPQPESINEVDDWESYASSLNQEIHLNEYTPDNKAFNQYMDDMLSQLSLKQYLMLNNSPKHTKRYRALSLTGLVHLGHKDSYVGADLTGNWYRRNTRIFVNIRNLAKTKNERILVIYGAAHKWVLDELFEGSPEFKVVQPFTDE